MKLINIEKENCQRKSIKKFAFGKINILSKAKEIIN